jgi:hypothetical protein
MVQSLRGADVAYTWAVSVQARSIIIHRRTRRARHTQQLWLGASKLGAWNKELYFVSSPPSPHGKPNDTDGERPKKLRHREPHYLLHQNSIRFLAVPLLRWASFWPGGSHACVRPAAALASALIVASSSSASSSSCSIDPSIAWAACSPRCSAAATGGGRPPPPPGSRRPTATGGRCCPRSTPSSRTPTSRSRRFSSWPSPLLYLTEHEMDTDLDRVFQHGKKLRR